MSEISIIESTNVRIEKSENFWIEFIPIYARERVNNQYE